jgi:hypothetical protein
LTEVVYNQTVDDVMTFMRHRSVQRLKPVLIVGALVLVFVVTGIAAYDNDPKRLPGLALSALVFLVCAVAAFLLVNWVLAASLRMELQTDDNLVGERRLTLGPDSLSVQAAGSVATHKWKSLREIVVEKNHAFFYTSKLSAVIVPRRAFPSSRDFDAFIATAREFHKAV